MQSKKWSIIEQFINILIGFLISQCLILYILPYLNISLAQTYHSSFQISAVFILASFIRGYILRRLFNKLHGENRIDR